MLIDTQGKCAATVMNTYNHLGNIDTIVNKICANLIKDD